VKGVVISDIICATHYIE